MRNFYSGFARGVLRAASVLSITGDTRPRPVPQPHYPAGMERRPVSHPSSRR
ncbi:hypothetical protein [Nitratireductor sp. XY-223]|uniref:hypothetical protein n=1 Tax=Nitratireductor sp. XY-223 TaxID=2561926 RepID=UPI00145C0AC1|nr:hypothetical protein [Nitratireductor sp. XY-223]